MFGGNHGPGASRRGRPQPLPAQGQLFPRKSPEARQYRQSTRSAPTPARGYLQERGRHHPGPTGAGRGGEELCTRGGGDPARAAQGAPGARPSALRTRLLPRGSNFGDCQRRRGGSLPSSAGDKGVVGPPRQPQAPLLHATSQGSSEHCAPRGREPSRLPSHGSTGRGKATCPRPALPEGPWAPRAEGGQTGRE